MINKMHSQKYIQLLSSKINSGKTKFQPDVKCIMMMFFKLTNVFTIIRIRHK